MLLPFPFYYGAFAPRTLNVLCASVSILQCVCACTLSHFYKCYGARCVFKCSVNYDCLCHLLRSLLITILTVYDHFGCLSTGFTNYFWNVCPPIIAVVVWLSAHVGYTMLCA